MNENPFGVTSFLICRNQGHLSALAKHLHIKQHGAYPLLFTPCSNSEASRNMESGLMAIAKSNGHRWPPLTSSSELKNGDLIELVQTEACGEEQRGWINAIRLLPKPNLSSTVNNSPIHFV